MSRYQKGKTNLDFTEARDSEWQWHQLGHMEVCTSLQRDNHASTSPLSFFTGRMPFLPSNQQCQSTEGQKRQKDTIRQNKHRKMTNKFGLEKRPNLSHLQPMWGGHFSATNTHTQLHR